MQTLVDRLRDAQVVPVVRHSDPLLARRGCELLAEAGVAALEITTTVPEAGRLVCELRESHPSVCVGAGTVLTAEQADEVLEAGAEFVVSPCWVDAVADRAAEAGRPYLPGAQTPGEIFRHWSSGAAAVKVFPADAAGGPGFLRAVKAVFPDVPLMPTGGVAPETARKYLDAGAFCVGMGGNLLPVRELAAGDDEGALARIRDVLARAGLSTGARPAHRPTG